MAEKRKAATQMAKDRKTGAVKGYLESMQISSEFLRLRGEAPKAGFAWDMRADMAAELEKPLPRNYPNRRAAKKK